MSEQLDNELKKRISEVFEHYEDTAPAQEGWLLLREKFPQKKQRRLAPIWWSVAATLLLLCLFGVWFYNKTNKVNEVIVKSSKKFIPADTGTYTQPSPVQGLNDDTITKLQYAATSEKKHKDVNSTTLSDKKGSQTILAPVNDIAVKTGEQLTAVRRLDKISPKNKLPLNSNGALNPSPVNKTPGNPADTKTNQQLMAAIRANNQPAQKLSTVDDKALKTAKTNAMDSSEKFTQSILAQQTPKIQQKPVWATVKDSIADISKSPMVALLAKEQQKETAKKLKTDNKETDKRILYSIYAATYFNYAEGSKSQMNTGAGFGTDIKLFSNFKLSTGIAIAKNTLNYNGQPTQAGILNEAIGVSRANDRSSASPVAGLNTPALGFSSLTLQTDPLVAGYDVSLTGLDVPLNIKYEFNPAKSDSYISAGLSSGTFINETYNYRYNNKINAFGFSPAIPDATTRKSFTRFDFARTLNLSLGMGYQITKHNRLVIEPFLKYPLSGLGSQQIRFGAGGVNLRLKFQGAKK